MNDTEILTWIAEHLERFTLGVHNVRVTWIDDGGFTQQRTYAIMPNEPDVEVLRHVVTAIASNETIDQTRIRTGERVG